MPGQRSILAMSFIASIGITAQVLSCALPRHEGNFWPLIIYLLYILLPIPIILYRRIVKETMIGMNERDSNRTRDYAIFFTAGIMVSSFALPLLMARSPQEKPVIAPISCFLLEVGNILCYSTVALFCIYFKPLSKT